MVKIYYDNDADLTLIKEKTVAIIGYGIQGRGQALCLRDSGCRVVVSEISTSPNFEKAKQDGFVPVSAGEAAQAGDIIQILTQDHVQAKVYQEHIKPKGIRTVVLSCRDDNDALMAFEDDDNVVYVTKPAWHDDLEKELDALLKRETQANE